MKMSEILAALSVGAVVYANYTSESVMDVTLNRIWWWDSSPDGWGNVEHSFIVIPLKFTLTQVGSTCWSPIYVSNRNV